jgi:hypothetical protein
MICSCRMLTGPMLLNATASALAAAVRTTRGMFMCSSTQGRGQFTSVHRPQIASCALQHIELLCCQGHTISKWTAFQPQLSSWTWHLQLHHVFAAYVLLQVYLERAELLRKLQGR